MAPNLRARVDPANLNNAFGDEQRAWRYAAVDEDWEVVLHARLSEPRGRNLAEQFLVNGVSDHARLNGSQPPSRRYQPQHH